ncbi:MAG: hypothetical protein FJ086_16425 [Deltaproteobacteria bacterium]|nr:hypothetical protein [Deltaproteobacteria bacterium]
MQRPLRAPGTRTPRAVYTQRLSEDSRHTGGARVGSLNVTWPFASLSASREVLRLSCLGREYLFPRRSITRLSPHEGLVSTGLRIEHAVADVPAFVVFWSSFIPGAGRFRRLEDELEFLGYAVD